MSLTLTRGWKSWRFSFILKLVSGSLLQTDADFSELRVSDPAELSGVSEEGVKITAKSPPQKEKRVS